MQNMAVFRDKAGRDIRIEVVGDCAYAYHDSNQIGDLFTTGRIEVDERTEDLPAEITGWNVNPDYRNAGIATEMVRQLVNEIGMLAPGKKDRGIGGENALTDDGLHTTLKCQRLGLVYPFPDEVDLDSDEI